LSQLSAAVVTIAHKGYETIISTEANNWLISLLLSPRIEIISRYLLKVLHFSTVPYVRGNEGLNKNTRPSIPLKRMTGGYFAPGIKNKQSQS